MNPSTEERTLLSNDLSVLFKAASLGKVEIRPQIKDAKSTILVDHTSVYLPSDADLKKQWFFTVCLRGPDKKPVGATVVWLDVDSDDPFDPSNIYPQPTIAVNSGHGTHVYWALNEQIPTEQAIKLSTLACIAFEGDKNVLEPNRVMRLPGSFNTKYNPRVPCTVILRNDTQNYNADELEEFLVASVVYPLWEQGSRHELALALGALLARAGWSEDRAIRAVEHICRWAIDPDLRDRITAVSNSITRHVAGDNVSASALRDALDTKWKKFSDALGVTERDGDLLLAGVPIGRYSFLERDIIRYIHGTGELAWTEGEIARWNGKVWLPGTSRLVVSHTFQILERLRVLSSGVETDLIPHAKDASDIGRILHGLLEKEALEERPAPILPLENGVLNLNTMEFGDHDRAYRNRYLMPIRYDPEAKAPAFLAFINEAAPAYVDYLQEWSGYFLTEGNPWEKLLWLFGPPGTGKSTYIKVMTAILGPMARAVNLEKVNEYTVASLASTKIASVSEISNRVLHTPILKSLVSGDPIQGRHPYGRPFSVRYRGKMLFASNELPPLDQADGMFRRLAIVPFEKIPDSSDGLLFDRIENDELPGVLNWAIEGLLRLRSYESRSQWEPPANPNGENIASEYRRMSDHWTQFIEDEIELGVGTEYRVAAIDLYTQYANWARERGFMPKPYGPVFYKELHKAGLRPEEQPTKSGQRLVRMWAGGRLYDKELDPGWTFRG